MDWGGTLIMMLLLTVGRWETFEALLSGITCVTSWLLYCFLGVSCGGIFSAGLLVIGITASWLLLVLEVLLLIIECGLLSNLGLSTLCLQVLEVGNWNRRLSEKSS
jgi:hypothetical protein